MYSQRTSTIIELLVIIAIAVLATPPLLGQDGFTDDQDIKSFLHDHLDGRKTAMVIGLVDEHGSRIFGAGGLDNGTSETVNGDTVFEIGSITKTFTVLLLEDMVERGEMKLDDPVSKFLPSSVNVPSRNGKEITLLELATHSSGLPRDIKGIKSPNPHNPFDYTPEQLYAFLSGYKLTRDPGTKLEYSNLGMGLLGLAIALKSGTDYESLVVNRICGPLGMNDTRATLTPELKGRLARGHDASGKLVANFDFQNQAMPGCGALRSTANDLLKYVSAQIGLAQSPLTPLIEKTHVIRYRNAPWLDDGNLSGIVAMPWVDTGQSEQTGIDLLGHAGGTAGYSAFIGFDVKRQRGVVVLFNEQDGRNGIHTSPVGWLLLEGVRLTPQIVAGLFPAGDGELVGVGVKLDFDHEAHAFRIGAVFPNTPASQAGLSPGPFVQKVDGVPTTGMSDQLLPCLIRGKPGTTVRLALVDPKRNVTNTVELIRRKFEVPKQ